MKINQINTDSKQNQGGVSSVVVKLCADMHLLGGLNCKLNPHI